MKLTKLTILMVAGLVLTIAASGCRKNPNDLKTIHGQKYALADAPAANPADNTNNISTPTDVGSTNLTDKPVPLADPEIRKNWPRDREIFKANMVHFDLDSSAVRATEKPKVAAVAEYLKANAQDAVEVEGHCDERGTEEYNRALGERRALALREELIRLGINAAIIDTTSYGKDHPLDPAHNEAAWKQNRRGEFILEKNPQGAR
jgi:peptidoglycan-associated lipoprotein